MARSTDTGLKYQKYHISNIVVGLYFLHPMKYHFCLMKNHELLYYKKFIIKVNSQLI